MIKDAESKDKAGRVRPFPLVGPDDTYDVKKYLDLLVKATEEILIHVGYDKKRLTASPGWRRTSGRLQSRQESQDPPSGASPLEWIHQAREEWKP